MTSEQGIVGDRHECACLAGCGVSIAIDWDAAENVGLITMRTADVPIVGNRLTTMMIDRKVAQALRGDLTAILAVATEGESQ